MTARAFGGLFAPGAEPGGSVVFDRAGASVLVWHPVLWWHLFCRMETLRLFRLRAVKEFIGML